MFDFSLGLLSLLFGCFAVFYVEDRHRPPSFSVFLSEERAMNKYTVVRRDITEYHSAAHILSGYTKNHCVYWQVLNRFSFTVFKQGNDCKYRQTSFIKNAILHPKDFLWFIIWPYGQCLSKVRHAISAHRHKHKKRQSCLIEEKWSIYGNCSQCLSVLKANVSLFVPVVYKGEVVSIKHHLHFTWTHHAK